MPRYYCDYCDTYLTHDSPSVRKQHNAGYKHKANVRTYYQQFDEQQNQSLIDQRIKEHLGQAAAFQHQVGASFNQHLMSLQPGQRPLLPGIRPPILPRPPFGVPGYGPVPMLAPPGAPAMPMQMGNLPRPPPLMQPVPAGPPNPVMYQTNPPAVATGGYNGFSSAAPSGTAPSGAQAAVPGAPVVVSGAASTSETNH